MDWRTGLGLFAGAITFLAVLPYIYDIFRGTTRPNIVTWFLWTLNGIILSTAQFVSGASWTLATLIASTLTTAIVTVLALRHGQRHYGWLDAVCFAFALIALAGWAITAEPLTAVILGVMAEIFAVTPTVAKTYREPESETASAYWLTAFAAILGIAASTKHDLANLLFPLYSICVNTMIATLAMRGRVIKPSPKS